MKTILFFVGILFSINLFSQSIEKFTYSYFSIDRNHKIGLPPKIQKNIGKETVTINYLTKVITIDCIKLKDRYDTTFEDNHLIYFRFKDESEFIMTEDRKRGDYDGIDFFIKFFPLIKIQ